MSINDIILFIINISPKEGVSFEDLLEGCFKKFPESISFSKNKNWPDSRKLDRPIRSLKLLGLIKMNSQDNFILSEKGRKRADMISRSMSQEKLGI